jgi:hypothetical protein
MELKDPIVLIKHAAMSLQVRVRSLLCIREG